LAKQDSSKRVGVLAKTVKAGTYLFVYSIEPLHPKSVDKRVVRGTKYFTPHRIAFEKKLPAHVTIDSKKIATFRI